VWHTIRANSTQQPINLEGINGLSYHAGQLGDNKVMGLNFCRKNCPIMGISTNSLLPTDKCNALLCQGGTDHMGVHPRGVDGMQNLHDQDSTYDQAQL